MDRERALRELRILEKHGRSMRLAAESWGSDWKTLISIILSARTRDETTIKICKELFKKYKNIGALARANLGDVQKMIRPVNFYRNKARSVSNCAKIIVSEYRGKVPHDFSELIKLPGVGRKTANVFLSEKGGDNIGVDTHVSWISQRLGWSKNNKPEKIEHDLERLFPKKYWSKVNPVLVRFGKTYISRRKKDEVINNIKKLR
jgi:endonuclease-3